MNVYYITLLLLVASCACHLNGQTVFETTAEEMFIFFNPQENLLQLEREITDDPESADELLKRARLRLYYGMDTEAMQDIEKVKTINPYALYLHGFYGTEGYVELIDKDPADATIELTLEQRMENYEEFFQDEMSARILDEVPGLRLNQIVDLITAERFDEAIREINSFTNDYPESGVAYDLLSVVYIEQGRYEEAAEALSDAIALDPNYAMAWFNFGRLERINGHYEYAKEYFDEAITLRADLSKAYFERAQVNKAMSNFEDAQEDYTFIINKGGELESAAVTNRGLARKMSGDFEGALDDLSAAIGEFPDNAQYRGNRGNLYLLLGQLDLAILDYDQSILLDADQADVYYNRGLAEYIQGRHDKACDDFQQAIARGHERAKEKYMYFCEGKGKKANARALRGN